MEHKKHPKTERTLVILKPDSIQRGLIGEIIKRFESIGLKIVALKMAVPTREKIEQHYTLDPNWRLITGEKTIHAYENKGLVPPSHDPLEISGVILENLKNYMTAGPVVFMVLQGAHAVKLVRKIVGGTEPLTSDVGTIRGDFVIDSYQMADIDGRAVRNLVHASGSVEEADSEIAHWFEKDELTSYRILAERMLYDVNLDGIFE